MNGFKDIFAVRTKGKRLSILANHYFEQGKEKWVGYFIIFGISMFWKKFKTKKNSKVDSRMSSTRCNTCSSFVGKRSSIAHVNFLHVHTIFGTIGLKCSNQTFVWQYLEQYTIWALIGTTHCCRRCEAPGPNKECYWMLHIYGKQESNLSTISYYVSSVKALKPHQGMLVHCMQANNTG